MPNNFTAQQILDLALEDHVAHVSDGGHGGAGVEGVGLALIIVTVIVLAAAAGCSGKCMYK